MRVLAVNIRSGGSRAAMNALAARTMRHDPDVVVISEFRDSPTGALLRKALVRGGFEHQAWTEGHRGNGVLIASVEPLEGMLRNPFGLGDDEYPNAILEARIAGIRLLGAYLPGQDRKRSHLRYLAAFGAFCNEHDVPALCIGDLNTGRNDTDIEVNVRREEFVDEFSTADLYAEIEQSWTEAWAYEHPDEYEFSWYPFRNDPDYRSFSGWRVDKALISRPLLPRLRSAEYDHFFRVDKLTDHSGIIVEFA